MRAGWIVLACSACGLETTVEKPPEVHGVVYTYPVDGQRDVPLGAHLIASFTDVVTSEGSACSVVGPAGPVEITTTTTGGGRTLVLSSSAFQPGTEYALACGEVRVMFTTRSDRPLAGAPLLVAINGSDPAMAGTFRPIFQTSTIQLAFSEPLDPRSVEGAVELLDDTGAAVPATTFAQGIHIVLDPAVPLVPGTPYVLRFSGRIADLAGETLAPTTISFTPVDGVGASTTRQTFRTRESGDPVEAIARVEVQNVMEVAHPLIGEVSSSMRPGVLATELGDPTVLGGPIAFTIPKGQRLSSAALDIALAGAIPSGLSTGDITIELLTDAGGRIYRNPYRSPDTLPDNATAPLLVDLSLDLAVFATDPTGNAVLAQTVLGVQLTGLALADEGALAIETLGALEIDLLGIGKAPTNLVLDLISDRNATTAADVQAPALAVTAPAAATQDWIADEGLELLFDEPIDIARARAGGIVLRDAGGERVDAVLESHGSVVVVRPLRALVDQQAYTLELADVADVAGNAMAPQTLDLHTQTMTATDVPPSVVASQPGTPCALVDATATSAGRCVGGAAGDDHYRPFTLAGNERVRIAFDQRLRPDTVRLGTACNTGSVRVEHVDERGACVETVAGSLLSRGRELAFAPDQPWQDGARYRVRLVSGPNTTCDAGELCGTNGKPANFDPLRGTAASAAGGPDLVIEFAGAPVTDASTLLASASPYVDLNGSGRADGDEQLRDENRVALRIAGTSGLITGASFPGADCVPATPEKEACMYMLGMIPAQLGARRDNCTLPDGSTVATCIPVAMAPQVMYSTSMSMTAAALGIGIATETGMSVMRMREPADHPLEGYIVDRDNVPTMVAALDLYMDAPDMSLPLSQHDLHSKQLSVALEGPLEFRPDGRIQISLHNVAEAPITVGINAPLGITGTVKLVVPVGEMKLQLLSPALRGRLPW